MILDAITGKEDDSLDQETEDWMNGYCRDHDKYFDPGQECPTCMAEFYDQSVVSDGVSTIYYYPEADASDDYRAARLRAAAEPIKPVDKATDT